MNAARDRAFGRYYAKHGLVIGRSDIPPQPADRYSSWAARYFKQPPDQRNPPSRIQLPESQMSAVILSIFGKLSNDQTPEQIRQEQLRIIREDVRNALFGFAPTIIAQAQARAERHHRNGYRVGQCIDRAVTWARGTNEPTPPRAA